jgi:hypothetical protein
VHASAGAVVYERATALPRIRWAGTSEVVPDGPTRVQRLTEGVTPGTVLLDDDSTPAAAGAAAPGGGGRAPAAAAAPAGDGPGDRRDRNPGLHRHGTTHLLARRTITLAAAPMRGAA